MSGAVLDKIIEEVRMLGPEELLKVQQLVNEQLKSFDQMQELPVKPRITGTYTPKDRSRENEWLQQHQNEYAGQWIALDGDRLLSHGPVLKEVMAAAHQAGVTDPLVVRAESDDALPFAGI